MTKVELNLNGESTVLGGPGPRARQIIEFIRAIPNGKYFDADGISRALKVTRDTLNTRLRPYADELQGHQLLVPASGECGRRFVYGSKRGIAALKKQLQDAGLI